MSKKITREHYKYEPPTAVEVEEKHIQRYIDEVEHMLLKKKEKYAWAGTGRAMVIGMKSDKEYYIFVVRNGYEEIILTKNKK